MGCSRTQHPTSTLDLENTFSPGKCNFCEYFKLTQMGCSWGINQTTASGSKTTPSLSQTTFLLKEMKNQVGLFQNFCVKKVLMKQDILLTFLVLYSNISSLLSEVGA